MATGGAIATMAATRGSSRATASPTQEPNEKPPTKRGPPGARNVGHQDLTFERSGGTDERRVFEVPAQRCPSSPAAAADPARAAPALW